jgi:hypothetical protein
VLKIEAILPKNVVLEVFAFAKFWHQRYCLVVGRSVIFSDIPGSIPGNVVEISQREEQETHIKRLHLTDAIAKITEKVHMPCEMLKIEQSMGARNRVGMGLYISWRNCLLGIDYWAPRGGR